ncbi:hypothetical protein OIE69_44100 (plasmid) [Actinacidiphila glaucinigra]|uniref:hypothetical protein n=1 Tax=Actinacidiphila glaucinigra TaxID=235986 RepID=UPI002DDA4312|nr:hypothetical protein [Actinacidiphila glaucinigra]WSD65888.1 hypothetical protein OIE69_44100 [Actinacidiphila glaucinigra]
MSAFHTDPAPGAVSRALTQLHSLTSPEAARAIDVIAGRTQPDGARLLLLLALWADHRAAGGEELLSALRRSKPSSANHPPSGPAGKLAAQLMAEPDGPRLLGEAEELLSMINARERESLEHLARAGGIRPGTRYRYRLSMPDGSHRPVAVFPSASAAWQHLLHHDTPQHPIGIVAETTDGQDVELSPARLHDDVVAERALGDETVSEIHSGLLRAAEVAWLQHRLTGPARYPDADHAASTVMRPTEPNRGTAGQWASATLEAMVRLGSLTLVERAADILNAEETRPLKGQLWLDAFQLAAQQALSITMLSRRELRRLDTEELVAHWQILRLAGVDDPRLALFADQMLTELSARDPGAQRLRAVLEPIMADTARDWTVDASQPHGQSRRQQAAEAFQAARAFTSARILHRVDWDRRDHIDVTHDALAAAGIDDAFGIAAGLAESPDAAVRRSPLAVDAYAQAWMAAHPDAWQALHKEDMAAALAADAAVDSHIPQAAANAVYRQLRADRLAAVYSVLGRLTSPVSAPTGPYTTLAAQAHASALRHLAVATFGSAQRAVNFFSDHAAHLEHTTAPQTTDSPDAGDRPHGDGPAKQASALRRAAVELASLFPELHTQQDSAGPQDRLRAVTAQLAAGAAARRRPAPTGLPHAHDPAQRAATQSLPGCVGPARH